MAAAKAKGLAVAFGPREPPRKRNREPNPIEVPTMVQAANLTYIAAIINIAKGHSVSWVVDHGSRPKPYSATLPSAILKSGETTWHKKVATK